jgi:hypothetical protein
MWDDSDSFSLEQAPAEAAATSWSLGPAGNSC